jgi:parallel beta-helix repeat protein
MKKYRIACLACTAAVLGTGLAAAAPSAADQRLHVVRPGESIQKAVDAAGVGDTVLITPGTYKESVLVTTAGLTLRGMGSRTVIQPGTKKAANACAEGGNGICVVGTKELGVKGVTVANLTVTGFPKSGVSALWTDGLTVRNVSAVKNGVWGIAQERSVRSVLRGNTALDNGDAGLFLANTIKEELGASDTGGTIVDRNKAEGNRIGITVRRLRNLTVANNRFTGNCAGVFVVGDENKPKTGALTVRDNEVSLNNKSCPASSRLEAIQGSGIVLTGAEDTVVTGNRVTGHSGTSGLAGGIVLYKSFVGVTSDRNRISDNVVENNSPADLVNTDTGTGNTFERNTCKVSRPTGLC